MKNLIKYNKVMFKAGNWFTKFFMISIVPFIAFVMFNTWNEDGLMLVERGGLSLVMIIFFVLFLIFYPIRNYLEVKRIVNGTNANPGLKDKYRKILKELEN